MIDSGDDAGMCVNQSGLISRLWQDHDSAKVVENFLIPLFFPRESISLVWVEAAQKKDRTEQNQSYCGPSGGLPGCRLPDGRVNFGGRGFAMPRLWFCWAVLFGAYSSLFLFYQLRKIQLHQRCGFLTCGMSELWDFLEWRG